MKDYSGKMRSMDIHRGKNYEMNIIIERPEFANKDLVKILDSSEVKYEIRKGKIMLNSDNYNYRIDCSKNVERKYHQLKILGSGLF